MTAMVAVREQEHYRIRDDTTAADPGTPNWVSAEDDASRTVIDTDITFRVRFTCANTGNQNASPTFSLYFSHEGGSFTEITGATLIQFANASSSGDGTALTAANFQLSAGTGSTRDGAYDEDNSIPSQTLNQGEYTEYEFGLTIDSGQVSDADTIDLRVYENDTAFDVYDFDALIEVNLVAAVDELSAAGVVVMQ